jgi:hypothetical protein
VFDSKLGKGKTLYNFDQNNFKIGQLYVDHHVVVKEKIVMILKNKTNITLVMKNLQGISY